MKVSELIGRLSMLDRDQEIYVEYKTKRGQGIAPIVEILDIVDIEDGKLLALENLSFLNKKHKTNADIVELYNTYHKMSWQQRYEIYINSPRWKEKRVKVLERDNYLCQSCLEQEATEVHHTNYTNAGCEPLFELVSVCNACHLTLTSQSRYQNKQRYDDKVIFGSFADYLVSQLGIDYDEIEGKINTTKYPSQIIKTPLLFSE